MNFTIRIHKGTFNNANIEAKNVVKWLEENL